MSGLSDYNNAISAFNSGSDGLKQFAQEKGDRFIGDWKNKVSDALQVQLGLDQDKKEKLENIMTAGSLAFPLVAPVAGKSLSFAKARAANFLKTKLSDKVSSAVSNKSASLDSAIGKAKSAAQDAANDVGAAVEKAKGTVANLQSTAKGTVADLQSTAKGTIAKPAATSDDIEMSDMSGSVRGLDTAPDVPTRAIVGGGENVSQETFNSANLPAEPEDIATVGDRAIQPEVGLGNQATGAPDLANSSGGAFTRTPAAQSGEISSGEISGGLNSTESAAAAGSNALKVGANVTSDVDEAASGLSKLAAGTEEAEAAAPELSEFILPAAAIAGVVMSAFGMVGGGETHVAPKIVSTATGLADSITKGGYAMAGKNSVTTLPASNSAF